MIELIKEFEQRCLITEQEYWAGQAGAFLTYVEDVDWPESNQIIKPEHWMALYERDLERRTGRQPLLQ